MTFEKDLVDLVHAKVALLKNEARSKQPREWARDVHRAIFAMNEGKHSGFELRSAFDSEALRLDVGEAKQSYRLLSDGIEPRDADDMPGHVLHTEEKFLGHVKEWASAMISRRLVRC